MKARGRAWRLLMLAATAERKASITSLGGGDVRFLQMAPREALELAANINNNPRMGWSWPRLMRREIIACPSPRWAFCVLNNLTHGIIIENHNMWQRKSISKRRKPMLW